MSDKIRVIDTKMLFPKDSNTIEILHNGIIYILRITKDDKLILTK